MRKEAAQRVEDALTAAGAVRGSMDTYHVLRVEAGTPLWGADIDETNLPQEVGRIQQTISFTKGCYIGQETIARIRTYGHVNRSLGALKLAEDRRVPRGARVHDGSKEVGQVTSSVRSPRLGTGLALAYLRRGHQEPGTVLEVEAEDRRIQGVVINLPVAP
jgi:folate-binding protein YgfZ